MMNIENGIVRTKLCLFHWLSSGLILGLHAFNPYSTGVSLAKHDLLAVYSACRKTLKVWS